MSQADYHGMPHEEIEKRRDEVPPNVREHVYNRVVFSGNYGIPLCPNFQRFVRYNMTQAEAERQAWAAFGKCGYNIRYYDSKGRELERRMVEPVDIEDESSAE